MKNLWQKRQDVRPAGLQQLMKNSTRVAPREDQSQHPIIPPANDKGWMVKPAAPAPNPASCKVGTPQAHVFLHSRKHFRKTLDKVNH